MARSDGGGGERQPASAWAPFGHLPFAVLWGATVLSNTGTWMHDVGAGWLMTVLSPVRSPLVVAAVQAATTLPVFLFALVAGALADIMDRRSCSWSSMQRWRSRPRSSPCWSRSA